MNWIKRTVYGGLAGGAVLFASAYPAGAVNAPSLGSAQSFAVLGGTTVTNTGPTTIIGDLGVSPGSAITGSGTITLTGATHAADAVALQAQNDVTTAYNVLASEPCTQSFTGTAVEVGGQVLSPGVYCYASSAQLTGTLTLSGDGVYIFKTGSTLTTAAGSTVALFGGAQVCNVFWQIGSSADLFANTTFVGSILALTSINLQSGTSILGRTLARNGAMTMDTNTVSSSSCAAGTTPTTTPTPTDTATPTDTPTDTPGPTNTPVPTNTPTNTATGTPTPTTAATATNTAGGSGSVTPLATVVSRAKSPDIQQVFLRENGSPTAPTTTPTRATPDAPPESMLTPRVPGLPNTGGAPPRGGSSPWLLVLVASVVGSLALGFSVRAHQGRAQ